MATATYSDLAAFGLPLVTPSQPSFASLVHDIESRPEPFGSWPIHDLSNAAVLLNETGNAILGRWLKKTYNKLRNFLHVPSPFTEVDRRNAQSIREFFEATARDLERFVRSDFTFAAANTVTFTSATTSRSTAIDTKPRRRRSLQNGNRSVTTAL